MKSMKTKREPVLLLFRLYRVYCRIVQQRSVFQRNDRVPTTVPRFRFPLNPNPVIFSGRYTGIGNGIAHSNGHRFPPTAVAAGGRSRRGTMPGDDIANIWLDSGANVLGCVPRGAPALAPP